MAFDEPHIYMTAHWLDSREPLEGGQVGIRFNSPLTIPSQVAVDACKPAWQTFWQSVNAGIPIYYGLKFIRLAAVDTTGHYTPGTFSFDGVFGSGTINSSNSTTPLPLQVACASTFLTDVPRGPGSHGRAYFPPIASSLGADGRWTTVAVNNRSSAVATLLTSLNAALVGSPGGLSSTASVFSKGGRTAGPSHHFILGVKTGTRPDMQRRRAKQVVEAYGTTSAVTH
jgi:hypothetical protein